MKKRVFGQHSRSTLALWLWVVTCTIVGSQALAQRPNILFIITDDQGAWTMGCSGNKDALTPNMDRLANEGVRLSNAFTVTPVCSPSRVATITGRYSSEFGILDWINPKAEPEKGLDPAAVTWPKLLEQAGYRTGLVGKWHLGSQPKFHPTKFGYSHFAGFLEGGVATKDPILEFEGETKKRVGLTGDLLTEQALQFIQSASQDIEKPWCLSLHYRSPHAAYLPVDEEIWKQFEHKEVSVIDYPDLDRELVTKHLREYHASIAEVDRNLGKILRLLDDRHLANQTLVIFTSDHGYNLGHHGLEFKGNAHWRLRHKVEPQWPDINVQRRPNMFDTSLRVPALLRLPSQIPGGKKVDFWTTNLDWFPTICEAVGITLEEQSEKLRGQSIWPIVSSETKNPKPTSPRELFFEYSMRHGSTVDMRAVRTERWKFMRDRHNVGRRELYDLQSDPDELQDLSSSSNLEIVDVVAALDTKLDDYFGKILNSQQK